MSNPKTGVDTSNVPSPFSLGNRLGRALWGLVWLLLFRPSPRLFFAWRRLLLRLFGAQIGRGVHVYPSAKIWAPWNLRMDDHSAIGFDVDCYCQAPIHIGKNATVSQYTYLCSGSHDITDPHMKHICAPIHVGDGAWICARAFVGPGVTVGEGAVVAACAVVVKNVDAWTVAGGNPAKFIKKRDLAAG